MITDARSQEISHRLGVVMVVSLMAGLVLGPVDLAAQKLLPYPWANLANASAVWALGAFGLGFWVREAHRRAAIAGVVLLVVAVESYFLAATLVQHDSLANLTSPSTGVWLVFAVLAGALFATAGAWARSGGHARSVVGPALAGSVLFAEALVLLHRSSGADRSDNLRTAFIEAVLGLAVVLAAGRSLRQRVFAAAACVPLSALGFLAFLSGGFGR